MSEINNAPGVFILSTLLYEVSISALTFTILIFTTYNNYLKFIFSIGLLVFMIFGITPFINSLKSIKAAIIPPPIALIYIIGLTVGVIISSTIESQLFLIFIIFTAWTALPILIHIILIFSSQNTRQYIQRI